MNDKMRFQMIEGDALTTYVVEREVGEGVWKCGSDVTAHSVYLHEDEIRKRAKLLEHLRVKSAVRRPSIDLPPVPSLEEMLAAKVKAGDIVQMPGPLPGPGRVVETRQVNGAEVSVVEPLSTVGQPYKPARPALRPGDRVLFGRPNGEKTLGRVVRVSAKSVSVEQLEERGTSRVRQAGAKWRVHPSLVHPAPPEAT